MSDQEVVPAAASPRTSKVKLSAEGVVLWNMKETKSAVKKFVNDYAEFRASLWEHMKHKGHVALKYSDDLPGFCEYARNELKLESDKSTIKLQLAAAEVSENVGVTVPMVIGRQLAKLPADKQKAIYNEVVTSRETEGKSANEMEEDVRRVVRKELGIEEKEPVSDTDSAERHPAGPDTYLTPEEHAQEPRTDDLEALEAQHTPDHADGLSEALEYAKGLLLRWSDAYEQQNADAEMEAYRSTKDFLK